MTRIHTIILVSYITLLLTAFDTVAVQEAATTSVPAETTTAAALTTASESLNETTYYGDVAGDRVVRTVSAEYADGTAVLVLESDLPRTVTMIVPTSSISTGIAAGNLVRRPVPPGRTMIRIDPPGPRVALITSYSVENNRYTEIRSDDGDSALIAGPFTGTDVRDTAIGGALGTSFDVLLVTIRRRLGFHRDTERVA